MRGGPETTYASSTAGGKGELAREEWEQVEGEPEGEMGRGARGEQVATVGGLLVLQGHGGSGMGVGQLGGMAPVRHGAQWRCIFPEPPRQLLNNLQKGPAGGFNNLIEAPGHFYKMCKNSYGLQLTFRCSTKFGLAK